MPRLLSTVGVALLVGQRLVRPERIVELLQSSSCEMPARKRARRAHGDAAGTGWTAASARW